jgi:FkbM family methyltransferase
MPGSRRKTQRAGRHFDFIEIGTSDFNTLLQKADDSVVGLSVEPLVDYLERLPERARVTKVNAAVSDRSGSMEIYYVPDAVRREYGLPGWMKGTNKIGAPHPTVVRYLAKHGLPASLMHHRRVPVLSVEGLFRRYRVGSVEYLKVDTEGHDTVILGAYLDMVERRPGLRARRILFESNALTAREAVAALTERLRRNGYRVETRRQDTLAVLEDV